MLQYFFLSISAFECLMGAILYLYNYTKHQAPRDLNATIKFPYNDHVPQAGLYLECAAGGLFILTSLLTVLDIMYYEKKETSSIAPVINEEKPSVGKDKTINENKKKGDKLVLEDVTEEKTEKKK